VRLMNLNTRAIVRAALTAGTLLSAVLLPVTTRAAASANSSTTWTPTTIVNHVFARSFELDNGALTISPFHGVAPVLSPALEANMWATYPFGGRVVGIGVGVVTVNALRTSNTQRPRVTSLVNVPAFVGLTDEADLGYMCAAMRVPGSRVVPVSHGWEAVIFPLNPTKSDAVFAASSNICGRVRPNTIDAAYLVLSVRWHLSPSGTDIVVSVPACATMDSWGGGGGGYVNPEPFSFAATVHVLDRPLGQSCSPATNFDAGTSYASPSTVHGSTGPVRQVSSAPIPVSRST